MARYDFDLIVIGGGSAGLTVTSGAAQLGVKTLLVEREEKLGGDCLHFGCVPSKTLIKSARVSQLMKRSEEFGLPPVPGASEPVDFRPVADRIRSVIETIQPHDSPERFRSLGAEVEFGEAAFTDPHTLRIGGKTVTARKFVLAAGSSPSAPPFPGMDSVPCLTNREIFSLDELPPSLIVLGAGPIAIEMAQSFARLGSRVTVIQRSPQILSREDKDMADTVLERLREEGVRVFLESEVQQVSEGEGPEKIRVTYTDARGNRDTVTAAKLLAALGRTPNIDGLGLENAGVEFTRKGVGVDARLRTSSPHIYAAGDITGAWQFTHAAGYEGGVVIANAVLGLPRKASYTWMPWATYSEPELASIGMNEKAAEKAGLEYTVWTEPFKSNDRALAEGETEGMLKLILGRRGRPLGVQICGHGAGDLINEWVAVLGGGVKLSTLASAVHPYPTLGEISKRVSGKIFSGRLFSPTVRKILRFVHGYRG